MNTPLNTKIQVFVETLSSHHTGQMSAENTEKAVINLRDKTEKLPIKTLKYLGALWLSLLKGRNMKNSPADL